MKATSDLEDFDHIPRHVIMRAYDDGKMKIYVDKGLVAALAGQGMYVGKASSVAMSVFLAGLAAFIPLAIWVNWWSSVLAVVLACAAIRLSKTLAADYVRRVALSDGQMFEHLRQTRVLWFEWVH